MRSLVSVAVVATALLLGSCAQEPAPRQFQPPVITLEQAIAAPYREQNRLRDRYRHPLETLQFFGIESDMTVVEIWPGGGWYSEILAPFLAARGRYIAAQFPDTPSAPDYQKQTLAAYRKAIAAHPELYSRVTVSAIGAPNFWQPAPPNSADLVLSFRNVHNWLQNDTEREMFAAFYRTLKPGGVLGVVEHRAVADEIPRSQIVRTGYVPQDYVIELATAAGFAYVGWEEINANPKDTKNYPAGVWTLPPTLRLGQTNRDQYLAIGESDRMTLKFVKPDPNAPAPMPSDR